MLCFCILSFRLYGDKEELSTANKNSNNYCDSPGKACDPGNSHKCSLSVRRCGNSRSPEEGCTGLGRHIIGYSLRVASKASAVSEMRDSNIIGSLPRRTRTGQCGSDPTNTPSGPFLLP